jgi:hypothetical protein
MRKLLTCTIAQAEAHEKDKKWARSEYNQDWCDSCGSRDGRHIVLKGPDGDWLKHDGRVVCCWLCADCQNDAGVEAMFSFCGFEPTRS